MIDGRLLQILLHKFITEQGLPEHHLQMYENEQMDVCLKVKVSTAYLLL